MYIEGVFDESRIVRHMIEREDAFSILFDSKAEIRCAHHKGIWTVALIEGGYIEKRFAFQDDCSFYGINDYTPGDASPLLRGYAQARKEVWEKKCPDLYRELPARILYDIFTIFVGPTRKIETITVVQSGRNSMVNGLTGAFELSPAE